MTRRPALAVAAALAALPAAAPAAAIDPAAPSHEAPHPAPAEPGAARAVAIDDARMTPARIVVAPGTRVTWTNIGLRRHTTTADTGLWDSPPLGIGHTFSIAAPDEPGTYGYFCRFHAFIRGSLTVSTVDLTPPEPVRVGRRATLRGTAPGTPAGTPVRIEVRRPGTWRVVAEVTTDAEGGFSAVLPPLARGAAVRAVVAESPSPSRRVAVQPHVAATLRQARLRVRVRPARAGRRLVLERLNLDTYRWHAHRRARLRPGGAGIFRLHHPGVYRVLVRGGGGLADVRSGVVEFRPSQFRIG